MAKQNGVFAYGVRGEQYGIWNSVTKKFQFGICEDTPMLAIARLTQHIGDGARKWRFQAKVLPKELREKYNSKSPDGAAGMRIELERKDRELKALRKQLREKDEELRQLRAGTAVTKSDKA